MARPLSRRTVLRGLGAAVALPWLEAMTPGGVVGLSRRALASGGIPTHGSGPLRIAFVFIPNGVDPAAWRPRQEGAGYAMPESLAPLESLRSRFSVLSGLSHRNAEAHGDGPGDHARSAACFLTGAHPRKTAGSDLRAGISIDQVLARRLGERTALTSLELGCEPALTSGNCDSGYSCAYSANISWKAEHQPLLKEIRPRAVFERLFSTGPEHESADARRRRLASRRSLLDFVAEDTDALRDRVGTEDRRRLDEYLEGVRALEQRVEAIERADADPGGRADHAHVATPEGVPNDYREHVRLMNELLVLAFRTDRTRVASLMLANEGSNRAFPFLDIPEGHHHLSHHGGDEAMVEKIRRINRFQSELFADLLRQLDAARDGERSLLDDTIVVYGSAIADGNRHDHHDLPVLLAGGGAGTLQPGRHVRFPEGTPMCNLFMSLMGRAGVEAARFGDSTGELTGI